MFAEKRPGWVLAGRYRLIEPLGTGGFGRVWKARDERLRVDVAVKEVWLPPAESHAEHAERVERAEREARNAARLRHHPNIVAVHDVVTEDETPWIVMQLVDGESLKQRLDRDETVPVDEAAAIAVALLQVLRAAHELGIVHRDIKPDNVLLTRTGEILLTDFGIARDHAENTLTAKDVIVGSFEYLAPERIDGDDRPAGDLFSLGVTLYHAVEGFSPFRRKTVQGTLVAAMLGIAPAPLHAGRLTRLVTWLMEKQPESRPSIAQALSLLTPEPAAAPAPEAVLEQSNSPVEDPDSPAYQQRRTAEAGDRNAMVRLAAMLKNRGELAEAELWYRKAAEAGDMVAMYALADLLRRRGEQTEADQWYRKAAESRIAPSIAALRKPPSNRKP
ncbi:serine/threonine-protein kinase [Nocardia sp. NPDC088792]|uniref:serine/threonine-protein kinase n=1 Tax=Nocardia sp. NPDC088792 TaxID=3364332 RepID=UPI003829F530